jgi:formylglycine-generating enzyme required for sulfatase activity
MKSFTYISLLLLLLFVGCKPAAKEPPPPPTITSGSGIEMVLVPAGSFLMGSDKGRSDEKPQHTVSINTFFMDKYEVTQDHYIKVVGTNPSKFGGKDWKVYPVDRISWRQAAASCNDRSRMEGFDSCYDEETWQCDYDANGYRMPTEAEWEYACRAGTTSEYYCAKDQLADVAWFKGNSREQSHPVGQKKPNKWGLYDMAGNVYEWCNDYYDPNYYRQSPSDNPKGPPEQDLRVLRGGCWVTSEDTCRAAARFSDDPVGADTCLGYSAYGFRCVRRK